MKPEQINTIYDAENYCWGLINDYEAGISTKEETMQYLAKYTGRIIEIVKEVQKNKTRSDKLHLLDRYNKFLLKNGYTDTDIISEEPSAIDEFMKTERP